MNRDGDTRPREHENLIHLYALVLGTRPEGGSVMPSPIKMTNMAGSPSALVNWSRRGVVRRLRDGYTRLTAVVSAPVKVATLRASPYRAAPLGHGLIDVWIWCFVARCEKPDQHMAMTAST